jgi:dienelactone hydrolase
MTLLRLLSAVLGGVLVSMIHAGIARAEIRTQYLDYRHGEVQLSGFLAYDDALPGRRPGVLLVHDRSGLNEKALEDTRMIARMGYVVLAIDMFGKGIVPKTVPEMQTLSRLYGDNRPLMRTRAQAGLEALAAHARVDASKIAAIGYCFGGTTIVELAESGAKLAGIVPVHGSFRNFTPADAKNITGPVLILHGAEDMTAPMEEVNKLMADLKAANVTYELQLYSGSGHGFTEPRGPAEVRADKQYKTAIQNFFKEVFGS